MKKLLTLVLFLIALPAAAHPDHASAAGFAAGFAHPFTGLDHLLAMFGVGLWSRRQQHGAALPLTFLLVMAAGAFAQVELPLLEGSIAATLAVLGLVLVAALRLPAGAALVMVAGFAFLHGVAHGREVPGVASAAGFLLASAALLMAGRLPWAERTSRFAGGAIGAAGLCLLALS